MADFPGVPKLQLKGLEALEAICRDQKGNAVTVREAGAAKRVLDVLERYPRIRVVVRQGLGTLACLAKIARNDVREEGGIPTIVKAMTKFKRDAMIQVNAAMTLGALCQSSKDNAKSSS